MKREIKFRGRRVDNGVWLYGSLVQYNGSQNWCDAVEIWKHDDSTECGTYQEVDPDTVGQFTGLLDKDGVEIYEGDYVLHAKNVKKATKQPWSTNPELICWDDDKAAFVLSGSIWGFIYHSYKIAGNIHDNPELMEVGQ